MGKKRKNNEDSSLYLGSHDIIAVADGMGGHDFGEKASKLAVSSIIEWFSTFRKNDKSRISDLAESFRFANKKVYDQLHLSRSGTTLVALQILDNIAVVANTGDSRCYLIRNGKIKQVTEDHSYVNAIKKEYPNLPDESTAMYKNVINDAIGLKETVIVDEFLIEIKHGDIFLLCSDGLTNELSDEKILRILNQSIKTGIINTCNMLIVNANNEGGRDNVTVAIVKFD
jgi:protein phosphatase